MTRPIDLKGKGWYIWQISDCEGGDPDAIVDRCLEGDLHHLLIKVADGTNPYGIVGGIDKPAELIAVVRSRAPFMKVGVWQYTYGWQPVTEANLAISRCNQLAPDFFVVDAESQYKEPGMGSNAVNYMDTLRAGISIPILLASYRYPSVHPEFPWVQFRERSDGDMPQVYWEQAHNPGYQLNTSRAQFADMTPALPFFASGAAYATPPIWASTPADVIAFLQTAHDTGVPAVNFWEWGRTKLYNIQVWQPIQDFPWPVSEPPPPPIGDDQMIVSRYNPDVVTSTLVANDNHLWTMDEAPLGGYLEIDAVAISCDRPIWTIYLYVKQVDGSLRHVGTANANGTVATIFPLQVKQFPGEQIRVTYKDSPPGAIATIRPFGTKYSPPA
jgi:hypothetical protein